MCLALERVGASTTPSAKKPFNWDFLANENISRRFASRKMDVMGLFHKLAYCATSQPAFWFISPFPPYLPFFLFLPCCGRNWAQFCVPNWRVAAKSRTSFLWGVQTRLGRGNQPNPNPGEVINPTMCQSPKTVPYHGSAAIIQKQNPKMKLFEKKHSPWVGWGGELETKKAIPKIRFCPN